MSDHGEFFREMHEPGSPLKPLLSVLGALTVTDASGPFLALRLVRDALCLDGEARMNAVLQLMRRLNAVEAVSKSFLSSLAVRGKELGLRGTSMEILEQLPEEEIRGRLRSYAQQLDKVFA